MDNLNGSNDAVNENVVPPPPKTHALLRTRTDGTKCFIDSRGSHIKGDPRRSKWLMDETEAVTNAENTTPHLRVAMSTALSVS